MRYAPNSVSFSRLASENQQSRNHLNPIGSLEADLHRTCKGSRAAVRRSSSFKVRSLIGRAVLVGEAPAGTGALGLEIVARVADRIAVLPIADL